MRRYTRPAAALSLLVATALLTTAALSTSATASADEPQPARVSELAPASAERAAEHDAASGAQRHDASPWPQAAALVLGALGVLLVYASRSAAPA